MSLKDYLDKYFPNGSFGSFEGQQVEIISHFIEKFGVNVKIEGNLYLFKYDMIAVSWSFEICRECRGHIWRFDGTWKRVANPPNKFWNFSEGNCPIFNKDEFEPIVNQLCASRKHDGSLCTIWWDSERNDWRCSTSGTISPTNIQDYPVKFDELFWKLFGVDKKESLSKIGREYTFCFELCSAMNRIVSKYADDRVYLLLIRHNEFGTYLPITEYNKQLGVRIPEQYFLFSYDIKTKEDLTKWVEANCNDDADCSYKEGFVLYHNLVPIAKCKTEKYLVLHKISGADIGATRNNLIELFFAGGIDDVYETLVDSMKEFVNKLRKWYIEQIALIMNECKTLALGSYANQKEYAMVVLNCTKLYSSFYFKNKESILNKTLTMDDISYWFKVNGNKFDTVIKSL